MNAFELHEGQVLVGSNRFNAGASPTRPDVYRIIGPLGKRGRRGTSYQAEVTESASLDVGRPVFVKVPRVDLSQAYPLVTRELTKIDGSFVREASKQEELAKVPCIAHVIDKSTISLNGGKYSIPFLVQEYIFGEDLQTFLESHFSIDGKFSGVRSADDWFEIATQLVDVVRRVHNRGVVHGDIWPDNILMCERGKNLGHDEPTQVGRTQSVAAGAYLPYLVDFGDSILLEDEATGTSRERERPHHYMAPERSRLRGSWSIPADIYSLGGVLYYMATGEQPPDPVADKNALKETIATMLEATNQGLRIANPGVAHIIDKCLRFEPHDRFFYADGVRDLLRNYDMRRVAHVDDADLGEKVAQLEENLKRLASNDERHRIFSGMAASEVDRLNRQVAAMTRGHLEIVGDREQLIDFLLNYLAVLEPGDEYITITSPQYWTEENLGTNGRFLTMNKVMAQSGVHIRRVFVLAKEERQNARVVEILRTHLRSIEDLPETVSRHDKSLPAVGRGSYYTGYVEVDRDARDSIITEGAPVALWQKRFPDGTQEFVSIAFSMRPVADATQGRRRAPGQIGKVRFWASARQADTLRDFQKWLEDSDPLDTYPPIAGETAAGTTGQFDKRPSRRRPAGARRPNRPPSGSPPDRPAQ